MPEPHTVRHGLVRTNALLISRNGSSALFRNELKVMGKGETEFDGNTGDSAADFTLHTHLHLTHRLSLREPTIAHATIPSCMLKHK